MSRIIILFAVLCIASTGTLAEGFSSCEPLNSIRNYTHLLTPRQFKTALERCSDTPEHNVYLTNGTIALLKVFNAINKGQNCAFTSEMENKLIECVTSKTGFKKDEFTAQAGKQHFALDTIETVKFDPKTCQKSTKILNCIEEKFSENKVSVELKGCKDKIIRGFNVTEVLCRDHLIHLDKNSGFYEIPSKTLIFGSVAMLAELAIFSQS